jgi:hypothetical protein
MTFTGLYGCGSSRLEYPLDADDVFASLVGPNLAHRRKAAILGDVKTR